MMYLFNKLKEIRRNNGLCPSSKDGVNLYELVKEIIDTHYYEEDYQKVTSELIYGDTPSYRSVCETLLEINDKANK